MRTALLKGERVLLGRWVNGGREIVFFKNAETRFLPEIQLRDLEDIRDTDDDLPYVPDAEPFKRKGLEWLRKHRQTREQQAVQRPSRKKASGSGRRKSSGTKKKTSRRKTVSPEVKAKIRQMPPNMQEAFMKDMGIDSLD